MINFFLASIIWILAIYGIISIVKDILIKIKYKNILNGVEHYIYVKNAEDSVEAYVRDMIFKYPDMKNFIIVDKNSQDNTYKILEKLKEEYNFITIQKIAK